MERCKKKDLSKFITETALSYYPNSLCFKDKREIKFHNNWYEKDYSNIMVSIDACNHQTYKGNHNNGKCKPKTDIVEFLDQNIFYIATQKNIVEENKSIESRDSYSSRYQLKKEEYKLNTKVKDLFYSNMMV